MKKQITLIMLLVFASCTWAYAQDSQGQAKIHSAYLPTDKDGGCKKNDYVLQKKEDGAMRADWLSGSTLAPGTNNTTKGRVLLPGTDQWILYWGDGGFSYKGGGSLSPEEEALPILEPCHADDPVAEERTTDFSVSPNPSRGDLLFQFDGDVSQAMLAIFDLQGKELARLNPSGSRLLVSLHLQGGTYIARYTTKDGATLVKKIFIE